jgi:hypothetical protein
LVTACGKKFVSVVASFEAGAADANTVRSRCKPLLHVCKQPYGCDAHAAKAPHVLCAAGAAAVGCISIMRVIHAGG